LATKSDRDFEQSTDHREDILPESRPPGYDGMPLMLPYDAFMEEGKSLRSQGRFAEALGRFNAAEGAVPQWTKPWGLARYYGGLTQQDLMNSAQAVALLENAARVFNNRPEDVEWAARVGEALGLSLLRECRWAEAARVIEESNRRFGDSPEHAGSIAADLHNLAIAWTRSGDAARGLEVARKAVALHEKVDGPYHPNTVETQLIAAYALIETGDLEKAGAEIRRAAKVILGQAGEAHGYFADALLTEARRVARLGDGCAAEALARRAMFILATADISAAVLKQRQRDAADLERLWRTGHPARNTRDVALWRMSIQHTLRRYQVDTLDFSPSGDRPKEWFFFVPGNWPRSQAHYAARLVFAEANRGLNQREPSDPHFLDATQATATVPDLRELGELRFADLFQRRVWEPSVAFSLVKGQWGVPLTPAGFARALAALGVSGDALLPLGADAAALSAARANPEETLISELMF
jgi:tetratricopeptide (TPR) repeat protein